MQKSEHLRDKRFAGRHNGQENADLLRKHGGKTGEELNWQLNQLPPPLERLVVCQAVPRITAN